MTLFAAVLLPERRQRAYLKDVTDKTWDLAVALEHNTDATPWHAELTLNAVQNVLGTFMLARVKHERGALRSVPALPVILADDGEVAEVDGQEGYRSWNICGACGWRSDAAFKSWNGER